jgi:hypothetical protein
MSVKSSKTEESVQGKIVVLGDRQTGKSSLIRSLDPQCREVNERVSERVSERGKKNQQKTTHSLTHEAGTSTSTSTSFTVVEVPPEELDGSTTSVFLKFWEFHGKGQQEDKIAFPGALFCIITLDMRAPESANSAFNKWVALKEAHMPEAFLFVVGTFLDDALQRRVEVAEVCKACAQKEAIYIEVSNLDGSNILLLKRLLCQRLNHMLRIREELSRPGRDAGMLMDDDLHSSDEAKHNGSVSAFSSNDITPAILDQKILSNSVGSILSSALSVEKWEGFETEQNNLIEVGSKISSFIDELSDGISDAPPPLDSSNHGTLAGGSLRTALTEPDAEEVRHLFGIMGLSLPPSLQVSNSTNDYVPPKRVSVKVKVRLPDDTFSYLVLKSGDDVENAVLTFVANHNMSSSSGAVSKLVEVGTSMLQKAMDEQDQEYYGSSPPKKSPAKKPLKCKARIQLPDGQTTITTVSEGEDAMSVAKRIAEEHGLSLGYQHKIWEQLQGALASLEKRRKTSALI